MALRLIRLVGTIVAIMAFFVGIRATVPCTNGMYGADCTCEVDMVQELSSPTPATPAVPGNLSCSGGAWTAQYAPSAITGFASRFDVGLDKLWLKGGNSTSTGVAFIAGDFMMLNFGLNLRNPSLSGHLYIPYGGLSFRPTQSTISADIWDFDRSAPVSNVTIVVADFQFTSLTVNPGYLQVDGSYIRTSNPSDYTCWKVNSTNLSFNSTSLSLNVVMVSVGGNGCLVYGTNYSPNGSAVASFGHGLLFCAILILMMHWIQ